jgi:hypothetical protein
MWRVHKHGNDLSAFIKSSGFLELLNDYQLYERDSVSYPVILSESYEAHYRHYLHG